MARVPVTQKISSIKAIYSQRWCSYTVSLEYFLMLGLLILSFPSLLFANDYYVSSSGSDLNPGTLSSPFLTITHGIDVMSGGDTLYVRSGTYAEKVVVFQKSGTKSNPTVVMAYPGESPVIDGKESLPGADNGTLVMIWDNYIHFSGFEVKNSNLLGTFEGGSGICIAGFHCNVNNCKVYNCWSSGIILIGDNSIVEYCEVFRTSLSNEPNPGSADNGSGISSCREPTNGTTDHSVIRHNIVHDVWGEGISTFEATYTVIEDNIIYDNWSVNLYVSDATNCLVQRNLIYRTKDMQDGSQVGVFLGDERYIPQSSFNTIINNIVYGCRKNLLCNTLNNVVIANNTFGNSTHMSCVHITTQEHVNSKFINNLVFQDDALPVIYDYKADADIEMDHNLWSKKPSADAFGIGDTISDPKLAKTGSTGAGVLTANYFRLLETSPAINKGIILGNIAGDFFDNARDDFPDIGAHEYIVAATSVIITGEGGVSTITSNKGTLQLSAEILPADATNKKITWSIANGTGQATINSSGLVTAIANGTATATATVTDGSGASCTLVITISGQTVAVNSITIIGAGNATTITTYGGILQLSAAILPSEATNKTIIWSIADGTGHASITSSGLVTAIANGTVTATATANDGSGVSGNLVITISNQVILIESINVFPMNLSTPFIKEKNGTLQMVADILPEDAKNLTIRWFVEPISGNATIDNKGLLKGMSDGTVNVIATALDGSNVSGYCLVTICNQSEVTDTADNGYKAVQFYNKLIITPNNKNTQIDFYRISNIAGIIICQKNVLVEPVEIDLSLYPSGIYIVTLSGNQVLVPLKILIP